MVEPTALLTAEEVATRLRVSPPSVYRWAKRNVIPSVTIGGVVRFRAAEIDAIVAGDVPVSVEPDPEQASA